MRMQHLTAIAMSMAIAAIAGAQQPSKIDVPSRVSIAVGTDTSIQAVVKDASGKAIPGARVRFQSSDTSIVQVTMLGSVKGVSAGSARITAVAVGPNGSEVPGITATIDVTVQAGETDPVLRLSNAMERPKRGP